MQRWVDALLIVTGLLLYFFVMPHAIAGPDGVDRYRAIELLIDTLRFSPTPYSLIGPLFAVPCYWLGKLCCGFEWWAGRFNIVVMAGGMGVFYALLRPGLGRSTARRFILILVAASMFPNHGRNFYGDMFTAIVLAGGIMALTIRRSAWGWGACALAVANTPASLIGFGFVTVRKMWQDRRVRYGAVLVVIVLLVLGENWLRRGHPFASGYSANHGVRTALPYSGLPGFSYPFGLGLLSLLLSFGKGLLFFAPGLLLSKRIRQLNVAPSIIQCFDALLLITAGLIVVYAKWWAWYGGFAWGPRFLLIASVPASLALAVAIGQSERPVARLVTLGLLALSVWVGINGAVFHLDELSICHENMYANECYMWYLPEFSPLWRPFVQHRALKTGDMALIAYGVVAGLWLAWPLIKGLAGDAMGLVAQASSVCRDGLRPPHEEP